MCLHYLTYQSSCCMLWSIETNKIEGREWGDRVHWEIEVGMFLLFTSVLLFSLSLQTECLFKTSSTRKSNFQWLLICRPKKLFWINGWVSKSIIGLHTETLNHKQTSTIHLITLSFQKGAFVFALGSGRVFQTGVWTISCRRFLHDFLHMSRKFWFCSLWGNEYKIYYNRYAEFFILIAISVEKT